MNYPVTNHVFLPLMPKGVEHGPSRGPITRAHHVFLPLMPKGVEHPAVSIRVRWITIVFSSVDAERR